MKEEKKKEIEKVDNGAVYKRPRGTTRPPCFHIIRGYRLFLSRLGRVEVIASFWLV